MHSNYNFAAKIRNSSETCKFFNVLLAIISLKRKKTLRDEAEFKKKALLLQKYYLQ